MDQIDLEETPRPKRRRGALHSVDLSAPPSPTRSGSANESNSDTQSHYSGCLSPVKQMELLGDLKKPVVFCDFDDEKEEEATDVTTMRMFVQDYADGIGILAFEGKLDEIVGSHGLLVETEKVQFRRPCANDPHVRSTFGTMPAMQDVRDIVDRAKWLNRGAGSSEDDWNTTVHFPLLKLALHTSKHSKSLSIHSV